MGAREGADAQMHDPGANRGRIEIPGGAPRRATRAALHGRGGLTSVASERQLVERGCSGHHAAKLGKAPHATDQRIARMRLAARIIQQFVAVIRPERYAPGGIARRVPARLLAQQRVDHRDHVDVATEVIGLHEGPVRFLRNVAQMREMDAAGEVLGHGRQVVARAARPASRCIA